MNLRAILWRFGPGLFVAVAAIAISPFGIMAVTGRADLSFRINAISACLSAFLLLVSGAILTRRRARTMFFYLIALTLPFAALAELEILAIATRLADRISAFETLEPLADGRRYPAYLLSAALSA